MKALVRARDATGAEERQELSELLRETMEHGGGVPELAGVPMHSQVKAELRALVLVLLPLDLAVAVI